MGFPRHLSQHVGGFVISAGPLEELVPIENASMPDRTVIQWDKNDLDDLGLITVDLLGLGMLTAIRRALALVADYRGRPFTLASIPPEDPLVLRDGLAWRHGRRVSNRVTRSDVDAAAAQAALFL